MAGTSTDTRGGVATCIRALHDTPLWARWRVTHVVTHQDGSRLHKVLVFGRAMIEFTREIVRDRPAVVHLHTSATGSFFRKLVLFHIAKLARIPVLLHMHSGLFRDFHDGAPRPVRWLVRNMLTRADAVVALGSRWAALLAEIAPGARIDVIPNAVRLGPQSAQPMVGEPVHVVFLGLICDEKGTFDLVEAWARVVRDTGPARLTIAGSGEVERITAALEQLGVDGTVKVESWLEPAQVMALLASAQVLVLPSLKEGQPMAVLEAMAQGLCVVATRVGGIPDVVEDGVTGLLVPPQDVPALAAALTRVVTDDAERAAFGKAGHERVREQFDVEAVWRRFDDAYDRILRR